jgi:hypothetical protein
LKATPKSDLKAHVMIIHYGKRFPCDQCDFQARSRDKVTGDLSCDNIYQCKIIINEYFHTFVVFSEGRKRGAD